jgi:TetR/AcrR family transcriptional regulator, hemagglutinin/protease regulatory protein
MKKKLRLHPRDRKDQLEHFIIKAVSHHGIARVTHSHVCVLADVSVSTVHFYYKRRQDLVNSAIRQVESFLIDMFDENLDRTSEVEALTDLAAAFVKEGFENPDLIKVWLDWSAGINQGVWLEYQNLLKRLHEKVRNVLTRSKRNGNLPANFDSMSATRLYIGSGHTLQLMIFDGASKRDLSIFQKNMIRAIFHSADPI